MGRHKLTYKLKKPNKHHKYWRYTLSNDLKGRYISARTKVKYEALRDEFIDKHPLENVERLSKQAEHSRDILTLAEFKTLFPLEVEDGIKIWREQKYFTLLFLMVSSGMRSGEIRALKWADVFWEDSGIMITKAVKNSGKIGSVKEKKDKFVRLPDRAMYYLEFWKEESLVSGDDDFIFYGKETISPVDRGTISTNFRKALDRVGIDRENRVIVPHSLRHTFNTYSLGVLPSEVVRKFTGNSSESMSRYYYHPLLKQELKSMDVYQDKINKIWS